MSTLLTQANKAHQDTEEKRKVGRADVGKGRTVGRGQTLSREQTVEKG